MKKNDIELLINETKDALSIIDNDCSKRKCLKGIKAESESFTKYLQAALFPFVFGKKEKVHLKPYNRIDYLEKAYDSLRRLIPVLDSSKDPNDIVKKLFNRLPEVASLLKEDVLSAYRGDPACKSTEEVMLSYPSFEAISIYRVAHILYELDVAILPRMMTEYAHKITGIDIHPGAKIGKRLFIDHGTGVVIGETTEIGDDCKIYQGVTLGAKSFKVKDDGSLVKGIKRHPTIKDRVIIYSNATILGGDTIIGSDAVIGANVWITSSVDESTTVSLKNQL